MASRAEVSWDRVDPWTGLRQPLLRRSTAQLAAAACFNQRVFVGRRHCSLRWPQQDKKCHDCVEIRKPLPAESLDMCSCPKNSGPFGPGRKKKKSVSLCRDSVIVSVVLHASLQHSAWKMCVLCAFACSQVLPKLVSETLNGTSKWRQVPHSSFRHRSSSASVSVSVIVTEQAKTEQQRLHRFLRSRPSCFDCTCTQTRVLGENR